MPRPSPRRPLHLHRMWAAPSGSPGSLRLLHTSPGTEPGACSGGPPGLGRDVSTREPWWGRHPDGSWRRPPTFLLKTGPTASGFRGGGGTLGSFRPHLKAQAPPHPTPTRRCLALSLDSTLSPDSEGYPRRPAGELSRALLQMWGWARPPPSHVSACRRRGVFPLNCPPGPMSSVRTCLSLG